MLFTWSDQLHTPMARGGKLMVTLENGSAINLALESNYMLPVANMLIKLRRA